MFRVRYRMIAAILAAALFVPLLAASTVVASSVVDPFASRFTTNTRGSIKLIGNTLMTCPASATCTDALNGVGGTLNNNDFSMVYVDADSDPSTFDSSTADLNVPAGAVVLFAGLYWGAASSDANRDEVQFKRPGHAYATVTASKVSSAGSTYAAFADVTTDVVALGNADGTYAVANVQATLGTNQLAGWSLVIAYHDATAPLRNLTVFDGFVQINTTAPSELTTTVSGFITPTSGPVNAEVGMVTFEGDLNLLNDQFLLNGTAMSNAANPATNLFNSSISSFGSTVHAKNPDFLNQLGFDVDLLDGTGYIGNSDTSATLTFTTNGDFYYPTVLTFAVDVLEPEIVATKSQVDVNGGALGSGDEIEYTIDLVNNGNDPATDVVLTDPIPAGTTYVPDSASIVSGPGAGTVTDQAADDRGEYDAGGSQLVFRLGTGATASAGGVLAPSATTTVRFRVSVGNGLAPGDSIENQANVAYSGETLGKDYTAQSDGQANSPGDQPTVIHVNSPPDAKNDSKTTAEDTPVDIDVLNNDTDPDGADDLVPSSVDVTAGPAHGSVSVDPTTGVVTYTPTADYFGDDAFTYQVCDTTGACDTALVNLTVTPAPDPPVANDDSTATNQNTPVDVDVLSNDTDPDGPADLDPSSVAVTSGPAHGSVSIDPTTGVVTYTPANGYAGNDTFDYQVCDFAGACASATVTVGVAVPNSTPAAVDDNASTTVDTPVDVDVLNNDTDPDGPADLDPSSVAVTSGPAHGSVSIDPTTGVVTYTPANGYVGGDTFDYQVCDFAGACASATVDVTVNDAAAPPVAHDDSAATDVNSGVVIDVLGNDVPGLAQIDPATVTILSGPTHGALTIDPLTGQITYEPNQGYDGEDSFTYQVCDVQGACTTAQVDISVLLPDTAMAAPSSPTPMTSWLAVVLAGLLPFMLIAMGLAFDWRRRTSPARRENPYSTWWDSRSR